MIVYSLYMLYFLFLLLRRKGIKHAFSLTENETKFILVGLTIYCGTYLLSATLIEFDLKVKTFKIVSHHVILLAICVVLYIKMLHSDDS